MVMVERRVSSGGDPVDDKMVIDGKDLSNTNRGESVVRRSRNVVQLKKELMASSAGSPRRKKTVAKEEKPRWQTILSVLTKNLLLLAVLLWLGQNAWRWSYKIRNDGKYSPFAALDYEEKISEVETALKKTIKMLQVQVDAMDKKIGSEVGAMSKELGKQVDARGDLLEKELKKIEKRTDSLDKSLGELKGLDPVTREEFEKHLSQLRNYGLLDGDRNDLSLDQIRAVARDIVEKEIEKHAADGLGRVDYAVASSGARVMRHSEPYVVGKSSSWFSSIKGKNGVDINAKKMLEPSFGEPGQCFPLRGSSGYVEIKLRSAIIPEAITLEHVSKSVAYDRSSAPKDCQVSAWYESEDEDLSSRAEKTFTLAEFSYDLEKSNAQTFDVEITETGIVNMVRLDFTSNHGNSALTCIYRLRVHGYVPISPTDAATKG